MRALLFDPEAPGHLRMGDVPEPTPAPTQAVVRVGAISVNFADVAFLADRFRPGAVPGFDAAGEVVSAAEDGSGPPVGSRVATFGGAGGWAELRAVDTTELAVVPAAVELGNAAAVPAAGVTALRAVRRLGPLLGRSVLVTGASGGVGRFAVQLAFRAGAYVIASVGRPGRGAGLAGLGAAEVIVGLEEITRSADAAIDNVGGQTLAKVYALLSPGGLVLSVGMASLRPTSIDFERARMRAAGTRIEAFVVGGGFGLDLAFLLELVAAGELDPQVGWRGSWEKIADAAGALLGRQVRGKAVLELSS